LIVTYARSGGETQKWDYKPGDVLSAEAETLERITDKTFDEINTGLLRGAVWARRGVLWMLMKRDNPSLKYADVQFKSGEVQVDWSTDERAEMRKAIEANTDLTEDERELAIAALGEDEEPAPKES